jgi:hypothetical protein
MRCYLWNDIFDAQCGDGKRFVVRADEKLTAFVELESAIYGSQPAAIFPSKQIAPGRARDNHK